MSGQRSLDRRGFLTRGLAAASAALLGGCDDLSDQPWVKRVLDSAETLAIYARLAKAHPADDLWHCSAIRAQGLYLGNPLWGQLWLPAEACASLLSLGNAIHLALTANVILKLGYQRQKPGVTDRPSVPAMTGLIYSSQHSLPPVLRFRARARCSNGGQRIAARTPKKSCSDPRPDRLVGNFGFR